jgi:hypothetical protein
VDITMEIAGSNLRFSGDGTMFGTSMMTNCWSIESRVGISIN